MGRIAHLTSGLKRGKTPIAKEIDNFNRIFTFIALFVGFLFFTIAILMGYHWLNCIILLIGIIVANVPEGFIYKLFLFFIIIKNF